MSGQKSTPRDAQVMAAILKDMGITEYEPRVINQMLEFAYRYVTDVLDDAKIYSTHANKRNVDVEDVKLAVQCNLDHAFTTPPPRDLLMELASHKNNSPLPLIKPYTGPKLPPLERYCLISPNYRLKSLKKPTGPKLNVQSGTSLVSSLTPVSRLSLHTGATSLVRSSNLGGSLSLVTLGTSQPTIKPVVSQAAAVSMPIIRLTSGSSTAAAPSHSSNASFTISGGALKRKREDDDEDYDKA